MKTINSFSGPFRFLSNFWPCEVELDNAIYPTVEHAYQAAKTLDINERKTIGYCTTAGKAKRAGQEVTARDDWDDVKVYIMTQLVTQKFTRDTTLRSLLQQTRGSEIIEGNTWDDVFWGVCDGVGENHLGKILMQVREGLS